LEETVMFDSHGRRRGLAALALALLAGPALAAGDKIRTERVQFAKGASSAIVTGSIKGYETVDYLVNARQGQAANVSLATRHTATYFNLLAPGQTEVAFFNGSINGNQFEGSLPANGEYRIRVYMMRSAARRNEVADYRLEVVIAAAGQAATAPAGDAKVAGTGYHATGTVPCAMGGGQPTGSCPFGVMRKGQGSGMVTVTRPDGRQRVIFFEQGRATGYDQSQADKGGFSATRQGDTTTVRIGEERYEIPDAVVSGG
jgi:hypothetical protein